MSGKGPALAAEIDGSEYARIRLDDLVAWDRNPRQGMDAGSDRLASTIGAVGWGSDVLVQKSTRRVIGGHLRILAARKLGLEVVPCKLLDVDDARADELALADNRAAEFAAWEPEGLAGILEELDPARRADLGWSTGDLEALLAEIAPPKPPPAAKDPREVPDQRVEPGDLWTLGNHRLLCGDAREPADVARLCDGVPIAVAFTSPPYASQRKYDEQTGFRPIAPDDYSEWWEAIQANVSEHLAPDGSFFVNIKPHSAGVHTSLYVFDLVVAMVRRWGWTFAEELCWERIGMPGKPRRRFKNQFEPVYQFARGDWKFRPAAVRHPSERVRTYSPDNHWSSGLNDGTAGESGAGWADGATQGLAYPGNRLPCLGSGSGVGHTASFPAGLPAFFLRAYSDPEDVVFDPFSGSGSTIVACEDEGRRGLGMEISPAYCDMTLDRWERLTGKRAKKVSG